MAWTIPDKGEGDNVAVYVLCDPQTDAVRYVGKTAAPKTRLRAHVNTARVQNRTHKEHWINSLGARPVLRVIEWCPGHERANEREAYWIRKFRDDGHKLTNATDGGEGQSGLRHSEATRQKMSIANRGRVWSSDARAAVRNAHLGKKHALGKRHTEEARERHRVAAIGKAPFRGHKHSPETIERMRAAHRSRWALRKQQAA